MKIQAKPDVFMKARIVKGMSQRELAEKSGLSRSYISLIERGEKSLGPSAAKKISGILERKFDDLFFIEE